MLYTQNFRKCKNGGCDLVYDKKCDQQAKVNIDMCIAKFLFTLFFFFFFFPNWPHLLYTHIATDFQQPTILQHEQPRSANL